MYKKFFELSPVQIKFGLYGTSNTIIENAPAFWSGHRYYIKNSYNYSVDRCEYDQIDFELESVCPKRKIIFDKVKIKLEEYVEKLKEAYSLSQDYISFEVHISYDNLDELFCDMSCIRQNNTCKRVSKNRPEVDTVYIYFDSEKIKEVVEEYNKLNIDICNVEPASESGVQIETIKQIRNKEEKSMNAFNNVSANSAANQQAAGFPNLFENMGGFDLKFGPVADDRIASTMFGVVFKGENDRWYTFDKESGVRTDVTGLQFGGLPMMLFPASRDDVKKGDLILYNNEYYYVSEKKKAHFILISASTGIETKVYPATNILNMEIFTKVFVLMDGASLKSSDGKDLTNNFMLAMMLGMSQPNDPNGMQQWMLPLLLSLKGGSTPFAGLFDKVSEGGGLSIENLLPFMCMTQMGNPTMPGAQPNNNASNPLMMYMFMNQFMSDFLPSKSEKKKAPAVEKKKDPAKTGKSAKSSESKDEE